MCACSAFDIENKVIGTIGCGRIGQRVLLRLAVSLTLTRLHVRACLCHACLDQVFSAAIVAKARQSVSIVFSRFLLALSVVLHLLNLAVGSFVACCTPVQHTLVLFLGLPAS